MTKFQRQPRWDFLIFFKESFQSFEHYINTIFSKVPKNVGVFKEDLQNVYFSQLSSRSLLCFCPLNTRTQHSCGEFLFSKRSNKFLSHASYLLKIEHQRHDYSPVCQSLNISTLSVHCLSSDINFVSFLLNDIIYI